MTKPIGPFLLILLVACSLMAGGRPSVSFGQEGGIASQDSNYVDTTSAPGGSRLKSENTALHLSLWSTVLPTLTVFGSPLGLLVGPSVGYFYGGAPGRGWLGIGIRAVGMGGMLVSLAASWDCYGSECETGLAFFTLSAAITVGSAIFDIATVKSAVRKHNRSLQKTGWRITPELLARRNIGGLKLQLLF